VAVGPDHARGILRLSIRRSTRKITPNSWRKLKHRRDQHDDLHHSRVSHATGYYRQNGLTLTWASIENAATPIPASPVAPVPTGPTAFGHQIDKVRYTNPEQGGLSQDRARGRQHGHEGRHGHYQCRKYAHQNPDTSREGSVVEGRRTEPEAGSPA
jgi:hypothetical protein